MADPARQELWFFRDSSGRGETSVFQGEGFSEESQRCVILVFHDPCALRLLERTAHTDRFKAAVMGAGISHWLSFHGKSSLADWDAIHYAESPYELAGLRCR